MQVEPSVLSLLHFSCLGIQRVPLYRKPNEFYMNPAPGSVEGHSDELTVEMDDELMLDEKNLPVEPLQHVPVSLFYIAIPPSP